jgi:hypothetical protein
VPSTAATTRTALICFACNKQCSTQGALKRHQDEKCERKVDWKCPHCRWTGDRLIRHYAMSHSGRCPTCCSTPGQIVCKTCKDSLSECYQTLPRNKTWGCPYCCYYFLDFDSWNKHCTSHYHRGERWSWSMMIRSLLQQFDHSRLEQYDWNGCDWSRLDASTGPELRDDMQRLRFPKHVRRHREYCELQIDEVLVRYTYHLVAVDPLLPTFAGARPPQQAYNSHISLSRPQEVPSANCQDIRFPLLPSSVNSNSNSRSDTGLEFRTPTLSSEVFINPQCHQNNRRTGEQIARMGCVQQADSAPTQQGQCEAHFSHRLPIVTLLSDDELRSTSKGQSVESSESTEAYVIPHANSEGLQTLSPRPPYADPVNFEDRTGSPSPVLLDRCTASEASRMVPQLQNAEVQAEDSPVVSPQTQQYRDYASSFPLSDDVFQQYRTWPTTALEPEASWADAIFGPGLGDCRIGGYRKVHFP